MPLVSVVVPVFNGLPHLQACVDSILSQTHPELDIVLVDGGSTDGSREWLRTASDARIRTVEMPPGTTAADNWTAASRAARGDFVKLLCQDDILYPWAIEEQLADLEAHPDARFAVARRDIIDANGHRVYAGRGLPGFHDGEVDGRTALRISYLQGTNVFGEPLAILFRRPVLDDALAWNDRHPFLLDLELYTRVLEHGTIAVRTDAIGAFRVSSSSWSTRLVAEQRRQLETWQDGVEQMLGLKPHGLTHARARLGVRHQLLLRRLAYAALRLRGSFRSDRHS